MSPLPKPTLLVMTDGDWRTTTVIARLEDGTEWDISHWCQVVEKEADSPLVLASMVATAPREELEREFHVEVPNAKRPAAA